MADGPRQPTAAHVAAPSVPPERNRVVVDRAVGVLAERHGLETDAAFDHLLRCALQSDRSLFDLAREIVEPDRAVRAPPAVRADKTLWRPGIGGPASPGRPR